MSERFIVGVAGRIGVEAWNLKDEYGGCYRCGCLAVDEKCNHKR